MADKIIAYLHTHIFRNLKPKQICDEFAISKTYLMTVFKDITGTSVMKYYNNLKFNYAKEMIRKGNNNYTEISNSLGYSSVHYFSSQFKKLAGMTPTEYARSVKVRLT